MDEPEEERPNISLLDFITENSELFTTFGVFVGLIVYINNILDGQSVQYLGVGLVCATGVALIIGYRILGKFLSEIENKKRLFYPHNWLPTLFLTLNGILLFSFSRVPLTSEEGFKTVSYVLTLVFFVWTLVGLSLHIGDIISAKVVETSHEIDQYIAQLPIQGKFEDNKYLDGLSAALVAATIVFLLNFYSTELLIETVSMESSAGKFANQPFLAIQDCLTVIQNNSQVIIVSIIMTGFHLSSSTEDE